MIGFTIIWLVNYSTLIYLMLVGKQTQFYRTWQIGGTRYKPSKYVWLIIAGTLMDMVCSYWKTITGTHFPNLVALTYYCCILLSYVDINGNATNQRHMGLFILFPGICSDVRGWDGDESTRPALSPVGQVAVQAPSHCGDSARTCALADGWGRKDEITPKPQTG